MTKEELYNKFKYKTGWLNEKEILDEFFKDKVIIQRGENRHPYADVLHEYAENLECAIEECHNGKWHDIRIQDGLFNHCKYRIKPKEPIYEWQWAYMHTDMDYYKMVVTNGITPKAYFVDENEVRKYCNAEKVWKIEETKRERK